MSFLLRLLFSRNWLVFPPIFIGVAGVVMITQFQKELPRNTPTEQARLLPVIRVYRQQVAPTVSGFGSASAARRWGAIAEVQGRIDEIHPALESGNSVGANELLVRIDDTDRQLLLSQRQADLDTANAKLKELEAEYESDKRLLPLTQAQLKIAERAEQRSLELRGKDATSQSELEQVMSSRLVQEQAVQNVQRALSLYPSQMSGAKVSVALAEAKVREAERDIERTRIHSPFSGILSGVDLEVGQFIGTNQRLSVSRQEIMPVDLRFINFVIQTKDLMARITLSNCGRWKIIEK